MLHSPNILRALGGLVVLGCALQRLLETGVILCRQQETQTQIDQPHTWCFHL